MGVRKFSWKMLLLDDCVCSHGKCCSWMIVFVPMESVALDDVCLLFEVGFQKFYSFP